jgi:hypothetical protein
MTAHPRRLAGLAAVAAALVLPAKALGCWDTCVATFGGVFEANGTYYELTSCSETWPNGSNQPHTVCYYRNMLTTARM